MGRFAWAWILVRRGWLLSALLFCGGCAAGPHAAAIDSVDEEAVIAAAKKDSFPAAHAPVK